MRLQRVISIFLPVICPLLAISQDAKEEQFRTALNDIVSKIISKDSVGLANYVDKQTGIYLIYRVGLQDTYSHYTTIGFKDSSYPRILFSLTGLTRHLPLKYGRLPEYAGGKWNKKGAYADTKLTHQLLTETALSMKRNEICEISQPELRALTEVEAKSRRVVIVENDSRYLCLYLMYINNKWVLTIFDALTGDESA
jgi:hypothetical protein